MHDIEELKSEISEIKHSLWEYSQVDIDEYASELHFERIDSLETRLSELQELLSELQEDYFFEDPF